MTGIGGFTGAAEGRGGHALAWQDLRGAELGIHPHPGGKPASHAVAFDLRLLRAGHAGREKYEFGARDSLIRPDADGSRPPEQPAGAGRRDGLGCGSSPASTRAGCFRHDRQDRAGGGPLPPGPPSPLLPLRRQLSERRRPRPRRQRAHGQSARATLRPKSSGRRSRWPRTIIWRRGSPPSSTGQAVDDPAPPVGQDVHADAVVRPPRRRHPRHQRPRHRHLGPLRPFARASRSAQTLGGRRHARLPAYATIYPLEDSPARITEQIAPLLEQGFRHLKVCVEPWWAEPARVCSQNLTHLRDLVGQERGLMLDVAQEFSRLDQLAPYPRPAGRAQFRVDRVALSARRRRRARAPPRRDAHSHRRRRPGPHHLQGVRALHRGRRLRHSPAGPHDVRRLHRGACDSPGCWRAPATASSPTPTTPTSPSRPISTSWPRSRSRAWSSIRRVRHACGRNSFTASPPIGDDGTIPVPSGPGLGVTLNPDALAAYAVSPGAEASR